MLEEQAREFHPQLIAVWDENAAKDLAVRLSDMDVKIVSGMEGLLELARMPQNSRSSDHSDGKRAWSSDPSGRQ